MNQSCSKSKCIIYTICVVLLPIIVIAAVMNFAPVQVARLFINSEKIQSVFMYQQRKTEEGRQAKFEKLIKKDIKKGDKGNLLGNKMDPVIGDQSAKIAIVEYLDYKCGYCKKAHTEIVKILSEPKYRNSVRLIVKYRPVIGGEVSLYASEAAVAFYQSNPEKFADLHSKLFASSLSTKADVDAILKGFGTSYDKIKTDKARESIIENFNFARDEITGIPAFIIGEELVVGYITALEIAAKLDKQMEK